MFKYRYLYHRPETEIEAGVRLHYSRWFWFKSGDQPLEQNTLTNILNAQFRIKDAAGVDRSETNMKIRIIGGF